MANNGPYGIGQVRSFEIWFNERHLFQVAWLNDQIEKWMERGDTESARQMIDWVHGFWSQYHDRGKGIHVAGPYCRVSANGYACRVAKEDEAGSRPDGRQPRPADAL